MEDLPPFRTKTPHNPLPDQIRTDSSPLAGSARRDGRPRTSSRLLLQARSIRSSSLDRELGAFEEAPTVVKPLMRLNRNLSVLFMGTAQKQHLAARQELVQGNELLAMHVHIAA